MNKGQVFEYILRLEDGLNSLLDGNPIKDMLVFEIINGSLIYVHELDASSLSDEQTARGTVKLVIKSLFKKENLMQAFSKHVNCYNTFGIGYKNRYIHNIDKESNFVNSITCNKEVLDGIEKSLSGYVEQFSFPKKMKSRWKNKYWFGIAAMVVIIIGLFALLSKRPGPIVGQYVYIDALNVVHANRECCFDMNSCNSKEERFMKRKGVDIVDTTVFVGYSNSDLYSKYNYCPKCVTDECYAELIRIAVRNRDKSSN